LGTIFKSSLASYRRRQLRIYLVQLVQERGQSYLRM
jgi:hypothetical protein